MASGKGNGKPLNRIIILVLGILMDLTTNGSGKGAGHDRLKLGLVTSMDRADQKRIEAHSG